MENCEVCDFYQKRQTMTKLYYEDGAVIAMLSSETLMVILKRHIAEPNEDEFRYIHQIAEKYFNGIEFMESRGSKGHYYLYST